MYLGRHVVRHPARTLRPVADSRVRASTSTPWQMAPTGLPSRQKPATRSRSTGEPRYCRIPGAWPPGSSSPSKLAGSSSAHASVAENSGALVISVYRLLAADAAPSWPNRTPVSSRGSAAGTVPSRSVANTTWCPASRRTRHGTATSVTSKSRSGSGIRTRTRASSHLSIAQSTCSIGTCRYPNAEPYDRGDVRALAMATLSRRAHSSQRHQVPLVLGI